MRQTPLSPVRPIVQENDQPLAGEAVAGEASWERLAFVEAELSRVHEELGRLQRLAAVGRVAAGIAHEINNLLTPALGYAQLVRQRPHDAELRAKAYDRAIGAAERAAAVSRAMLALTREPQEGEQRGKQGEEAGGVGTATVAESCDIAAAAAAALEAAADAIEAAGATVTVELPDARVLVGEPTLTQVLLNLLLNAAHALNSEQNPDMAAAPSILVRGERAAAGELDGREALAIEVTDNGPGIPAALRDCLFEPLVRRASDPTVGGGGGLSTPRPGHGLGLSVCRDLVTAAGGSIEADEPPGGGACLRLILPMAAR